MPHFHDLPDGTSSINHTEDNPAPVPLEDALDRHLAALPPTEEQRESRAPLSPPPHPSYADGSAPAVNPLPTFNTENCARVYTQRPPARRSPWVDIVDPGQGPPPHPSYADGSAPPMPPPQTATQVNEARRAVRINPAWESAASNACEADPPYRSVDIGPSPPRRTRSRRGLSDPDAAIRKDPNAWSMREAVELCKLLEVVVPEAGFHIALTGGLLYKEGRRKDCDLMFYQIRQMEPNYEILWNYLRVAGVIRSPSYPENGWLVKATYRGKLIDCLFPNAGKKKKTGAANPDCYKAAPPTPPAPPEGPVLYRTGGGVFGELRPPVPPAPRDFIDRSFATQREGREEAAREADRDTIDAAVAASRLIESVASTFTSPAPSDPRPTGRANSFEVLRAEIAAHQLLCRPREAPIPPPPPTQTDEPF